MIRNLRSLLFVALLLVCAGLLPSPAAAQPDFGSNPTIFSPPVVTGGNASINSSTPTLDDTYNGILVQGLAYTVTAGSNPGTITTDWYAHRDFLNMSSLGPFPNATIFGNTDVTTSGFGQTTSATWTVTGSIFLHSTVGDITLPGYPTLTFSDTFTGNQTKPEVWNIIGEMDPPTAVVSGGVYTLLLDSSINWTGASPGASISFASSYGGNSGPAGPSSVPEPSSLVVVVTSLGLIVAFAHARRRSRRAIAST